MAGTSWLIDSKRIATKIKSASETCDPKRIKWKSNPERACPSCNHVIDNSDVTQEWPGLPRGVKFDPSDQELLWHLLAKVGVGGVKPHPFIDEFIPTVDNDDGICYTHPQNLPGVQQDGNVSHFFHRIMRAYNTGTRKRRKIQDGEDVRWHKTGKTKPVIIDGTQKGCKKILVLYMSMERGGKPEKTNWVMHQYHLGTGEDEKDGEFVVSKVFYQQQPKLSDKNGQDLPPDMPEALAPDVPEALPPDLPETTIPKVDPVNPKSVTPELPCSGMQQFDPGLGHKLTYICDDLFAEIPEKEYRDTGHEENNALHEWEGKQDDHKIDPEEDPKWWEGESQFLLDSQQLVEGLSLCDELLQSQSSCGEGEPKKNRPRLSDYAHIGVEDLKKDLEECQKLSQFDQTNIEFDTPPDFRLSQLEFGSQDSFVAWAGGKIGD